MKIRIRRNSIRFRLTRSEVETLYSTGKIMEKTLFNSSHFIYGIQTKHNIEALEASFENNTITLYFPFKETKVWMHTDKVGYENTIALDNGDELYLLLEKDFVCLDETIEDQSDNYPNPTAAFLELKK